MKRSTSVKQAIIRSILIKASRPLSAKDIADRMVGRYGMSMDTTTIGVNLGYMRRAGEVNFVSCLTGMHKYGHVAIPNMSRFWFPSDKPKEYGSRFEHYMAKLNMRRYESTLPLHMRRRKRPITDDMRQMVEDIGVGR